MRRLSSFLVSLPLIITLSKDITALMMHIKYVIDNMGIIVHTLGTHMNHLNYIPHHFGILIRLE